MTDVTSGPMREVRNAIEAIANGSLTDVGELIRDAIEVTRNAESLIDAEVEQLTGKTFDSMDIDVVREFTDNSVRRTNEAVQRGVALLDEYFPGWWDSIDLGTLNMGSSSSCICGQLFGPKVAALFANAERIFNETATQAEIDEEAAARNQEARNLMFEFQAYSHGQSGYNLIDQVDRMHLLAPNIPERVLREVADKPSAYGFNLDDDLCGTDPWAVSYGALGVLWENEIRSRHHIISVVTNVARQALGQPA